MQTYKELQIKGLKFCTESGIRKFCREKCGGKCCEKNLKEYGGCHRRETVDSAACDSIWCIMYFCPIIYEKMIKVYDNYKGKPIWDTKRLVEFENTYKLYQMVEHVYKKIIETGKSIVVVATTRRENGEPYGQDVMFNDYEFLDPKPLAEYLSNEK